MLLSYGQGLIDTYIENSNDPNEERNIRHKINFLLKHLGKEHTRLDASS
jgi:hypothetical protein